MSADEQAIRDLVTQWNQASMAGDVETVLSLIDEDAIFQVAGREPFGKELFEQGLRSALEHVRVDVVGDSGIAGGWGSSVYAQPVAGDADTAGRGRPADEALRLYSDDFSQIAQ
jgi:hypothetical protein